MHSWQERRGPNRKEIQSSSRQQRWQQKKNRKHPFSTFWVLSLLILLLALLFSLKFADTRALVTSYYHKLIKLSILPFSSPHSLLQSTTTIPALNKLIKTIFLATPTTTTTTTIQQEESKITDSNSAPPPSICLLWMAPFLSGGGYSSEAWSYVAALSDLISNGKSPYPNIRLRIEHHGDLESLDFWTGLPEELRSLAYKLHSEECKMEETVVICHSEPGAWHPPLFQTFPCPPPAAEPPLFVIGRTMFETDRLSPEHVRRCNGMDSIWIPTDFHASTFVQSGVNSSKVVKMVQPVDVEFFNPLRHKPLTLPTGKLILGSHVPTLQKKKFVFLSIFKWEYRKGWDVLLRSYLTEFCSKDGVVLNLLTNPYHSDRAFGNKILKFVEESHIAEPLDGWAPIYVIDTHIAQTDLPGLYKAADALVLPSRGEGWGRPLVEAMSMAVPVIATNWSGPTEFLTEKNSYPLPFDQMSEVTEGPFKGHLWAEPSVEKLRQLMRHVVHNPDEARKKGIRAREDMIRRYSPELVAGLVVNEILKISRKM
ncbi:hypothetical protein ACLOJK_020824 [Asimina triloba]